MSALVVRILVCAALLLAMACGLHIYRLQATQVELAQEVHGRADDRAAAAVSAAALARADADAIIATHQESLHVAELARDRQDADRALLMLLIERLLDAAAVHSAGGRPAGDPAAAGGGLRAACARSVLVLDVLDGLMKRWESWRTVLTPSAPALGPVPWNSRP